MNRRELFAAGAAACLAPLPLSAAATRPAFAAEPARTLTATQFGAVGDGRTDDTEALQAALDATFRRDDPGVLFIPPGTYRVGRTLSVDLDRDRTGNVTRRCGISGNGARLLSEVRRGRDVLKVRSRSTARFLLIEGLDILGSGEDGHGLHLECEAEGSYLYNICLRDLAVQNCGDDGCRMIGNVFESQVFNCYFRDNGGNGATFGHGEEKGILSSIHVFGCVFGGNGRHGAALINNCYDVSFHGCYFLLNREFGLVAGNGCTLLSNCGFENNHEGAPGFDQGGAGIRLLVFGTLIGCSAYSIFKQTHLIDAFVTNELTMIGCTGSGDRDAEGAKLAKLQGDGSCSAVLIGCRGGIEQVGGIEASEIGQGAFGARFGSRWDSPNQLRLGEYRLWVDGKGRLRLKHGRPQSDEDGELR